MGNGGTLQSTAGGGADLRGRRCKSTGEGKGDLISTLLGLKEWVWSGGERMNRGKKEPHKHCICVRVFAGFHSSQQRAYLLNGSVHLQSAQHTLHPWSPGERKRENSYITVSSHIIEKYHIFVT